MATNKCDKCHNSAFTTVSLALSVTCWCGEREVMGSIPGTGEMHVGLKKTEIGCTAFALHTAGPLLVEDDHVEIVKTGSSVSTCVLNTLTPK